MQTFKLKILSWLFIILIAIAACKGQNNSSPQTKSQDINEVVIKNAEKFLGKPYVAGTLEGPTETLVCNLNEFDCFTLVENTLALSNANSDDEYKKNVQNLRYRNGEIDGYPSRIHYFTEWVRNAQALGLVKDLSPELGTKRDKKINFMSTHRQYYSAFKTDDKVLKEIKNMELENQKFPLYEIPKTALNSVKNKIKTGDIIAFTSNIDGLDVNHVGFAYWKGSELHFLHASSEDKKVEISNETLQQYLNRLKKHSGIMVIRPQS